MTIKQLIKEHPEEIERILWDYSNWLNKIGYIDSDYYTEKPQAVDAYLDLQQE